MLKRIAAFVLSIALLLSLMGCKKEENASMVNPVVGYGTMQELEEAVGFPVTEVSFEGFTRTSLSAISGTIAEAIYAADEGESELCFRMTVTPADAENLSGIYGGKYAGGLQWDDPAVSPLEVQFLDDTLYFCDFTYKGAEGEVYYSLSMTETDFGTFAKTFSQLLTAIKNA